MHRRGSPRSARDRRRKPAPKRSCECHTCPHHTPTIVNRVLKITEPGHCNVLYLIIVLRLIQVYKESDVGIYVEFIFIYVYTFSRTNFIISSGVTESAILQKWNANNINMIIISTEQWFCVCPGIKCCRHAKLWVPPLALWNRLWFLQFSHSRSWDNSIRSSSLFLASSSPARDT